jgi:hypothetical protein
MLSAQSGFFYKEKAQMAVEMDEISFPVPAEVKIEFSLTAQVNVTDFTAQRKVSKLLLDHVGNLLYGERPSLVAGRRLLWRVPVWLALPSTGPLGQVGALDVDAQTGEILSTQHILEEIAERGNALARRATPTTE